MRLGTYNYNIYGCHKKQKTGEQLALHSLLYSVGALVSEIVLLGVVVLLSYLHSPYGLFAIATNVVAPNLLLFRYAVLVFKNKKDKDFREDKRFFVSIYIAVFSFILIILVSILWIIAIYMYITPKEG